MKEKNDLHSRDHAIVSDGWSGRNKLDKGTARTFKLNIESIPKKTSIIIKPTIIKKNEK